jgi:hypothetical protein
VIFLYLDEERRNHKYFLSIWNQEEREYMDNNLGPYLKKDHTRKELELNEVQLNLNLKTNWVTSIPPPLDKK